MTIEKAYGPLTGDAIGVILKELVRRAIVAINHQRFVHEAQGKENELRPGQDDFVTSADLAAQEIYVEAIRRCFPGFGIVAEENHLATKCTLPGEQVWITIDPLDGTKAFIRRQSHGVGTMIALVRGREIVSAYVGDVFTREIYGYRPDGDKVHRISEFEHRHQLGPLIQCDRPLSDQCVLIRDEPWKHSAAIRHMLPAEDGKGLFKMTEITGGSIGISMARLWKGEVGAAVLTPGMQTPWDTFPVYGISRKLGFRFVPIYDTVILPGEWKPTLSMAPQRLSTEVLVIHESRVSELQEWFCRYNAER